MPTTQRASVLFQGLRVRIAERQMCVCVCVCVFRLLGVTTTQGCVCVIGVVHIRGLTNERMNELYRLDSVDCRTIFLFVCLVTHHEKPSGGTTLLPHNEMKYYYMVLPLKEVY